MQTGLCEIILYEKCIKVELLDKPDVMRYHTCMSIFKPNHMGTTIRSPKSALSHIARMAAGLPSDLPKVAEVTRSGIKVGR